MMNLNFMILDIDDSTKTDDVLSCVRQVIDRIRGIKEESDTGLYYFEIDQPGPIVRRAVFEYHKNPLSICIAINPPDEAWGNFKQAGKCLKFWKITENRSPTEKNEER